MANQPNKGGPNISEDFSEAHDNTPRATIFELPTTWPELNKILISLHSGTFLTGAVAGISSSVSGRNDPATLEEEKEKEREKTITMLKVLNAQQDEQIEIFKNLQDILNKLIKIDPKNAERVKDIIELRDQTKDLEKQIEEAKRIRETLGREIIFQTGNNPEHKVAANLLTKRTAADENLITISVKLKDDTSEHPLHVVYKNAKNQWYIKDSKGNDIFLKDIPFENERQKDLVSQEIEWQIRGNSILNIKKGQLFGNDNPADTTKFIAADAAIQKELKNANAVMVTYDSYMSHLNEKRLQYMDAEKRIQELEKQKAALEEKKELIKREMGDTPDAKILTDELEKNLDLLDEAIKEKNRLKTNLLKESETAKNYIASGTYDEKKLIAEIPDEKLRNKIIERKRQLEEQLRELEKEKAEIEQRKKENTETGKKNENTEEKINKIAKDAPQDLKNTPRGELITASSNPADFVLDRAGNIVSYDADTGRFYTTKKDTSEKIYKTDFTEADSYFEQAWRKEKQFGNESDLKTLKMSGQEKSIALQIEIASLHNNTANTALKGQETITDSKIKQTQDMLKREANGGLAPDTSPHKENFNTAVAPATPENTASTPDQSDPTKKLNQPPPSPTSDARKL